MKTQYFLFLTFLLIVIVGCTSPQQELETSGIENLEINKNLIEPEAESENSNDLILVPDNKQVAAVSFSWEKDSGSRIKDGSVP